MYWKSLTEEHQLADISQLSAERPQMIFKHSTRCSISLMAKSRLERNLPPEGVDFYLLDLLKFRNLSNLIAERYNVHHESPQILIIKNGACVYDESHNAIEMSEIEEQIRS
jgi:bacillithiol system protein YtxJ